MAMSCVMGEERLVEGSFLLLIKLYGLDEHSTELN